MLQVYLTAYMFSIHPVSNIICCKNTSIVTCLYIYVYMVIKNKLYTTFECLQPGDIRYASIIQVSGHARNIMYI